MSVLSHEQKWGLEYVSIQQRFGTTCVATLRKIVWRGYVIAMKAHVSFETPTKQWRFSRDDCHSVRYSAAAVQQRKLSVETYGCTKRVFCFGDCFNASANNKNIRSTPPRLHRSQHHALTGSFTSPHSRPLANPCRTFSPSTTSIVNPSHSPNCITDQPNHTTAPITITTTRATTPELPSTTTTTTINAPRTIFGHRKTPTPIPRWHHDNTTRLACPQRILAHQFSSHNTPMHPTNIERRCLS